MSVSYLVYIGKRIIIWQIATILLSYSYQIKSTLSNNNGHIKCGVVSTGFFEIRGYKALI